LFVWNDAKKGDLVGVATLQLNSLKELKQTFKNYTEKIDILEKLPPQERQIFYLIASSEEGILQNLLWKKLKIDSSKCSRIIKSMTEKNLIIRDSVKSEGSSTYILSIKN